MAISRRAFTDAPLHPNIRGRRRVMAGDVWSSAGIGFVRSVRAVPQFENTDIGVARVLFAFADTAVFAASHTQGPMAPLPIGAVNQARSSQNTEIDEGESEK